MDTVGIRELQQHASAAIRRVEAGETLGVTDRGRLVAVLAPPSTPSGAAALLAAGRVTAARRDTSDLPPATAADRRTRDVMDELRAER